jgi:hypothetical protein
MDTEPGRPHVGDRGTGTEAPSGIVSPCEAVDAAILRANQRAARSRNHRYMPLVESTCET